MTAEGSKAAVAGYLEARTQRPSVFHHGNRGLTRDRIWDEEKLFLAVRDELDGVGQVSPSPYRGLQGPELHGALRSRMLEKLPWLAEPGPERITGREKTLDRGRLAAFAVVVLFVLTLPGIVLSALMPTRAYLVLMVLAGGAGIIGFLRLRDPLPGTDVPTRFNLARFLLRQLPLAAIAILLYVVAVTAGLIAVALPGSHLLSWFGTGPVSYTHLTLPTIYSV